MAGKQSYFLRAEDLGAWLSELAKDADVLVPMVEGDAVVFRPLGQGDIELERQPTEPPKAQIFPQTETLVDYRYVKDEENPEAVRLEVSTPEAPGKSVVFGPRPCGARGFTIYDRVYLGRVRDPYYAARRGNTAIIALACEHSESSCFCHWVGGGPADPKGSDVLATPVSGGYLLEPVTEKGEGLMGSKLLAKASDDQVKAAEAVAEACLAELGEAVDLTQAPEALLERFDDLEFWTMQSSKCISCGACTYLCPTCYCFNISDEPQGLAGKRIRTWDNCMAYLFTLEASGHNPRTTKAHRLRNRVGHKFSYYPDLHEHIFACCGCGRCIKSCPVSVDIREIVQGAIQARETQGENA